MSREWGVGRIIRIYNNGNKTMCRNYKGITLLNNAYENTVYNFTEEIGKLAKYNK